jgi:hypothetical protein
MKNSLTFTLKTFGKLSILLVVLLLMEGMFTQGKAYDFHNYTAIAWIFQSLLFVACAYIAAEWQLSADLDNKEMEERYRNGFERT